MVFLPAPEDMYPVGFATQVAVEGLTAGLCGASRPGHFAGVTTVVCKLFNLVGSQAAWFGLKDYQQFRVIQKMVLDLCMDVQVFGVATVREADGLAMSSRNAYLSAEGRTAARVLSRALSQAAKLHQGGEWDPEVLRGEALAVIAQEPLAVVDYLEVVDAETLQPAVQPAVTGAPLLMAMAVKVEKTRLIDNCLLREGIGAF